MRCVSHNCILINYLVVFGMVQIRKLLYLTVRLSFILFVIGVNSAACNTTSESPIASANGDDSEGSGTNGIQENQSIAPRTRLDRKQAEQNYLAAFGDLGKSKNLPLDPMDESEKTEHEVKSEKLNSENVATGEKQIGVDESHDEKSKDAHSTAVSRHHHEKQTRYQIASIDWHEVQLPYTVAIWILLASIAKIGFRMSKRFSEIFPDSSLLILVGLFVGILLSSIRHIEPVTFSLDSHAFFLYLLPPIVFDAGYFMPNRAFFDNLGSILTFAVIGTVWNMATIGISLWLVSFTGIFTAELPLLHILLFSSLISAVDPVAVIVVFEEIHVNEVLFITVFGESLLNDAVTVVLYEIFKSFSAIGSENLLVIDYAAGGISFFTVALGGVLIGLIWAFIVSFTTKYTEQVKVLNPVFVFVMPYCAYLTAEMFGMSAIMAIVFCGIAMKQYIKLNISTKAITSIKYFTKMLSGISETIIFMFLGLSTIRKHHWDIPFISLTVIFCLVYRTLGVIWQSSILNKYRLVPYSKVDQFVIAYGGLRGAIAFGLVVALPNSIPAKDLFVTATIVVIYFTVFLQGITMKPLVNWLKVELDDNRQKTMTEHMLEKQIDFLMVGLEDICGFRGHHWLRDAYEHFNLQWLRPILVRKQSVTRQGSKLVREFTRMKLKDAIKIARGRVTSPANTLPKPKTNEIDGSQSVHAYNNPSFEHPTEKATEEQLDIDHILPKKNLFQLRQKDDFSSSFLLDEMAQENKVKEWNQIGLRNVYFRKRSSSVPTQIVLDSLGIGRVLQKANEQPSFEIGGTDEDYTNNVMETVLDATTDSQQTSSEHPQRQKVLETKIDITPPPKKKNKRRSV